MCNVRSAATAPAARVDLLRRGGGIAAGLTSEQADVAPPRRESETQVYLPKSGVTQTATDRGTRPAVHLSYISGLRGHPDQEMSVVKVNVDVQ